MMKTQTPTHLAKSRGFTLIEIMIVVAVIAILASIALPSYFQYVLRAQRQNAKGALLQTAQWMERAATSQGTYPTTLPANFTRVEGDRYTVSLATAANRSSFTLTATPRADFADPECGNFTLTQTGQRGISGTGTVETCWGR